MKIRLSAIILFSVFLSACAQVPRESVTLSSTIGSDLVALHESHHDLAALIFENMRDDVNQFIDEVYAPYQIRAAMTHQAELAKSNNQNTRNSSILLGIQHAFSNQATDKAQANVLNAMSHLVLSIRNDIEEFRGILLEPLNEQEKKVLSSIDRSHKQVQTANAVITQHLSSIAKIHTTQNELLHDLGVKRNIRHDIGDQLSKTAKDLNKIITTAKKTDSQFVKVEETADKIKGVFEKLKTTFQDKL